MKSLTALLLFFLTLNSFAQDEHEHVKLIEEKQGKRVVLYAKNTDSISYDVFLKITTKDFRRSSNRPIIKNIPAKSKIKLMTLIQLASTEGKYNTIFIVNVVAQSFKLRKDHENLDFKLDRAIHDDKKVTLFTNNKCDICPTTKQILRNNRIVYTELNIDQDSTNYIKITKALKTSNKDTNKSQIPMLKVDDEIFNNIITVKDFTDALRKVYNSN